MPAQTLVSVIIPSYNYAAFLPQAVASVLGQRAPGLEVEVIVVDDGSTDNSPQILDAISARDKRLRVYRQENSQGESRNKGLQGGLQMRNKVSQEAAYVYRLL